MNLTFVDDTLLAKKISIIEANRFVKVLKTFQATISHGINKQKSHMYFINVSHGLQAINLSTPKQIEKILNHHEKSGTNPFLSLDALPPIYFE